MPAYARTWGWANFLLLCDVAMFLTVLGVWRANSVLLSSQAVVTLFAGVVWTVDVGWKLVADRHLYGGTEYMFDPAYPLWVRLLSTFHLWLPLLLLWALRKTGYDSRGWIWQAAISVPLVAVGRLFEPTKNINFAFTDPLFERQWGPAPIHVATICLSLIVLVYLPTHLLLGRLFRRAG
ncbi:MAG: hypothetical protein K6U02_09250 [Firmicutes bacterium]|nr:hypothetical protein [Bacillota bacterium]